MLIIFLTAVSEYDQVSSDSFNKSNPLNVITLCQTNLIKNKMITLTEETFGLLTIKQLDCFWRINLINRLITLSVIILSSFHCESHFLLNDQWFLVLLI